MMRHLGKVCQLTHSRNCSAQQMSPLLNWSRDDSIVDSIPAVAAAETDGAIAARRGHRHRRWWFAGDASILLVVGLGVGLGVGLSGANGSSNQPQAPARGLFPQRLFASNEFGGPKNHVPIHLVAAAAQVASQRSFCWTFPGLPSGTGWLYVHCTGGRVGIDFGGASVTSASCHGLSGVTGWAVAPSNGQTTTVRVSARQAQRWGAALYRGRGRDGLLTPETSSTDPRVVACSAVSIRLTCPILLPCRCRSRTREPAVSHRSSELVMWPSP